MNAVVNALEAEGIVTRLSEPGLLADDKPVKITIECPLRCTGRACFTCAGDSRFISLAICPIPPLAMPMRQRRYIGE
jgi:hypothetical protein